jgi:hypothetical protein
MKVFRRRKKIDDYQEVTWGWASRQSDRRWIVWGEKL